MELSEFVKVTLSQIVKGVAEAQAEARTNGGYVCPAFKPPSDVDGILGVSPNLQSVYAIQFDVAVVVSDARSKSAAGKISVVSLGGAGVAGEAKLSIETTSRIKFIVPLELPLDTDSAEERKARDQTYSENLEKISQRIAGGH